MEDMISRKKAIDALDVGAELLRRVLDDADIVGDERAKYEWGLGLIESYISDMKEISSTQPEKRTEERTETHTCDYINRKDAIDAHYEYCNKHPDAGFPVWSLKILEDLPSAQPEPCEDAVSRQAVYNVLDKMPVRGFKKDGETIHGLISLSQVNSAIINLPSAQPEPCVDTIDALDESIKHFDDMAEECRRNANIEQNDYMDMRDDAAEYRQLSIWLNELKWLRERFQSQPDLSEYSDKLWKAAYERGKADTQQRWIPCSERLPEEYGEYRITWVTSCAPSKRFIGDSEYEVTSVWDEERKDFKGEWLLDDYIKHYPDVKVIAWKPLEEPYRGGR